MIDALSAGDLVCVPRLTLEIESRGLVIQAVVVAWVPGLIFVRSYVDVVAKMPGHPD